MEVRAVSQREAWMLWRRLRSKQWRRSIPRSLRRAPMGSLSAAGTQVGHISRRRICAVMLSMRIGFVASQHCYAGRPVTLAAIVLYLQSIETSFRIFQVSWLMYGSWDARQIDDLCRAAAVTCKRLTRCCTSPRPLETFLKIQLRLGHDAATQGLL